MGTDILPGHTYTDGEFINGPSLTEHVSEAVIKPTFYSSRTAKSPVVLTDEILIRDTVADNYRKVSLATLQALMVGPGSVIQSVYSEYTSWTGVTAVIPVDDTIPQNTEGTEILSATITPRFSSSSFLVSFFGMAAVSPAGAASAALFKDAGAAALAANECYVDTANGRINLGINFRDPPSTISARTYRIRIGPNAGFMVMNGNLINRFFGGTARATLIVQEIKE